MAYHAAMQMLEAAEQRDSRLGDLFVGHEGALHLGGSQAMAGNVDHIVNASQDAIVAIFSLNSGITASATDRVIQRSYDLMGLISFFTVGEDEVRAWTIGRDTDAVDAAEVIHSDIKKGFIRAEVLVYDALVDAGTYAEARKKGTVRLEGKTYTVCDGDIINFRFNV